jgi:hypothetical protein
VPVLVKKNVDVKVIILRDVIGSAGVPALDVDEAKSEISLANEAYAQLGIKLSAVYATEDPPNIDLRNGLDSKLDYGQNGDPKPLISAGDAEKLLGSYRPNDTTIAIYIVKKIGLAAEATGLMGVSFEPHSFSFYSNYGYSAIVSSEKIRDSNAYVTMGNPDRYQPTIAHEIGHILLVEPRHYESVYKDDTTRLINLMKKGPSDSNTVTAPKRFLKDQEDRVFSETNKAKPLLK